MDQKRRSVLRTGLAAAAAGTVAPLLGADVPARLLVVAYDDDFAPFSFADGKHTRGIMPDLLDAVFGPAGVSLEHIHRPWRRVQAEVRYGSADAMCTFASESRREYALASKEPIVLQQPHMFYLASSPHRARIERARRPEDLLDLRVLDLQGNQWAEQNLKIFPRITFIAALNNVFQMLVLGRGDIHISLSPAVSRWRIKKLDLEGERILSRPVPFIAADVPFSLLIRRSYPSAEALLAMFDEAMRKPAMAQVIARIYRGYGV
jgi:polar amino acid transport system substrate-binding protein